MSLFNSKFSQMDLFDKYQSDFKEFYRQLKDSVRDSARSDAVNPPNKDSKIKSLPEVNTIKYACSKKLAEVSKTVKGMLESTLTSFQQSSTKLIETESSNTKIDKIKSYKKDANDKLESDSNKKDADLVANEAELKSEQKNHKLDLENKVKHSLFWACLAAIILVLAISGSEIAYTAKSFELTGLSFYEKYLVAFGLGLSTIFLGVGIIEILRSEWKLHWRITGAVFSLSLILAVYYVIGKIRVELLKKALNSGVEFSDLSAVDFLSINLIFFVAIVLIHWLLWPEKHKFSENNEYNNVQKLIDRKEKEIKSIQKERSSIPTELSKEQAKISAKFDKEIADTEKEFAEIEAKRSEDQIIFNNVYGRLNEFYDELNFFYKETVGLYITTLNKYRNDGVFLTMDEPLEDLPNPFKNFKYLDDNPAEPELLLVETPADINIEFDEV